MTLTLKKVAEPTVRRALSEFRVVDSDGTEIARVYQRESSKTGFKRGYCVGQVTCKGWFYRLATDPHTEHGVSKFGMSPLFNTRSQAMTDLATKVGGS